MSTLSERLRWAMAEAEVSAAELARFCQVKQPSVSDWLSGKTKQLAGKNLIKAAQRLGVTTLWLGQGQGPPRRGETSPAGQVPASLAIEEMELIEVYRLLSTPRRKLLTSLARELIEKARQ